MGCIRAAKLGDPGKTGLQHYGEGPKLQRDDAAEDGGSDDAPSLRPLALAEETASQDWPPYQEVTDETAVEGHVPYVGAQGQEAAVGKEKTLDRQDHDHGEEARLGSQQGGEQHAAAHMAGGAGAGDGVVDHLPRKDQGGGHRHDGELLRFIVLPELVDGNAGRCGGGDVHHPGHGRGQQSVCHVHS